MPALGMIMLTYWKPVALAIAITAMLAYRAVLVHQRDTAQANAATMAAQLDGWKAAEAACEDAVARQNRQVAAIKAEADRAAAAAETRQANVASAAEVSAAEEGRRAVEIARAPVATDCAGAIRWGNARANELGRW